MLRNIAKKRKALQEENEIYHIAANNCGAQVPKEDTPLHDPNSCPGSLTGKLCLQHEELAKKCIAPLVRELEVSQDLAVRNNVVIVLCDLCIRYTTMADRYIPDISVCLKDPEPFVRKQTLILLTNLLQVSI